MLTMLTLLTVRYTHRTCYTHYGHYTLLRRRSLNLADNCLAAEGGALLAAALHSNRRLTELDLSNNQVGPAAGARVLAAVSDEQGPRRTLRTLRLGGNQLGDRRAVRGALCSLITAEGSALRTLHLEHNSLGVRTAAPLATALAESALTELDLSWNLLRSPGVEARSCPARRGATLPSLRYPPYARSANLPAPAPRCTLHTAHCTLHNARCTMHNAHACYMLHAACCMVQELTTTHHGCRCSPSRCTVRVAGCRRSSWLGTGPRPRAASRSARCSLSTAA